jgi:catechol 2,3-dioxygenase-like lactoylglutathione lyase family enzyme
MIEHATIHVSHYPQARAFYTAALAPLGYELKHDWGTSGGFMEGGHTSFIITEQKTLVPAHVAFRAKSKEDVQGFYDAAVEAGGKDNGAPGFRTDYGPDYYAAFVLDHDGNNIEACFFGEKADTWSVQ